MKNKEGFFPSFFHSRLRSKHIESRMGHIECQRHISSCVCNISTKTPHPPRCGPRFLAAAGEKNGSNIPRMLFTTVLPLHYLKGKALILHFAFFIMLSSSVNYVDTFSAGEGKGTAQINLCISPWQISFHSVKYRFFVCKNISLRSKISYHGVMYRLFANSLSLRLPSASTSLLRWRLQFCILNFAFAHCALCIEICTMCTAFCLF